MNQKKSAVTVKNVLRVLSFLCLIFVFCPAFLVSCSDQDVSVSAMDAVSGLSYQGEKVEEGNPVMLLCLFIPIVILVLLFIRKYADRLKASIICGVTVVDFILWLVFKSVVKSKAEEQYCTFKTTGWYVLNIIAMLLMIVVSALVIIKRIDMETDLIAAFTGGAAAPGNQQASAPNAGASAASPNAGAGNAAPPKMQAVYCKNCGAKLTPGAAFCKSCGTKV
jgi:uncharacterized membrane protein